MHPLSITKINEILPMVAFSRGLGFPLIMTLSITILLFDSESGNKQRNRRTQYVKLLHMLNHRCKVKLLHVVALWVPLRRWYLTLSHASYTFMYFNALIIHNTGNYNRHADLFSRLLF